MNMAEMFLNTLMKSIDIKALLAHPKIDEGLRMARQITTDFAEMKERLRRIEERLDGNGVRPDTPRANGYAVTTADYGRLEIKENDHAGNIGEFDAAGNIRY